MSMLYYDKSVYKNLSENEVWVLLLCGNYAYNKLLEKYDTKKDTKLTYRLGNYCNDKRRYPTVLKQLRKVNLIKDAYQDNITPDESNIEGILPGFSVEPAFDASGVKKVKEYSYSNDEEKPLKERGEAYKSLDSLNAYEVIYVYLHQDEYDFAEFKHTTSYTDRRHYSAYRTFDTYTVKIYPKKLDSTLEEGIIAESIKDYAKKHGREILSAAFKLNIQDIHDDHPYFTIQDLRNRYQEVSKKIKYLESVKTELEAILTEIGISNMSEEEYLDKILKASRDYTTQQSPIWIFDEEHKDKQELAKKLIKGTDLITETKSSR